MELRRVISDAPSAYKDCPERCERTRRPPENPNGCEVCPTRRAIDELDRECENYLREFCGEREDGTPDCDFQLSEIQWHVQQALALDRELGGEGYSDLTEAEAIQCLDILRSEEERMLDRAREKARAEARAKAGR